MKLMLPLWALIVPLTLLIVVIAGCEIEETIPPQSGNLAVSLMTPDSVAITGARIFVDGIATPRFTPATITGVLAGTHAVRVFKPGYVDTSMSVQVVAHQTVAANLQTVTVLESGTIRLLQVPAETQIFLNGVLAGGGFWDPIDTSMQFSSVGVGTFRVSAFLPDHATALPAQWTVNLTPGSVVSLTPTFVSADSGATPGDLAPDFTLPCDWDSSLYSLHDFRGAVVLVSFFFYNCVACVEEMPYISAVYNDPKYAGRVQFIGVDYPDTYATFARFREDHPSLEIRFPLVHDRYQGAKAAYGVSTMPANYIIDPTGRIASVQGALSESGLRQTIDQLLELQDQPTLRFTMRDTLITYVNPMQDYEFSGTLENLASFDRPVHLTVTPVAYADTARQTGACVAANCFAPKSGNIDWPTIAAADQNDSVRITVYSRISQWSYYLSGEDTIWVPTPQDSALIGDYSLDVNVIPDDNAAEGSTYRLHLVRAATVSTDMITQPQKGRLP
jgi:peroxiredoxin